MTGIIETVLIYLAIVAVTRLYRQNKQRQRRQEWERLHPLLKWDDWKHVVR